MRSNAETASGFFGKGGLLVPSIALNIGLATFLFGFMILAPVKNEGWASARVDPIKHSCSAGPSEEQKMATVGAGVTGFGDCQPFCNRTLLKEIVKDFIEVYKNKPIKENKCGCQVNHCFAEYAVARLAEVSIMVENGVNAGMSGYLFRSAKPKSLLYHVDPRSRPICDINMERWYDPGADSGLAHYYVGPSDSKLYNMMVNDPNVGPEKGDAIGYAKKFHSKGFEDFFAIDWSATPRHSTLVFFDTHQPDYLNIMKAIGMGFKLFLFDDNYNANDVGDMGGYSIKQVFARGGRDRDATILAYNLDFYYEMPPLISPYKVPQAIADKYKLQAIRAARGNAGNQFDALDIAFSQKALLDLEDEGDQKLFEMLLKIVPVAEFGWYAHMAVAGEKKCKLQ